MQETITGSVEKILFQDLNSGFNILLIARTDPSGSCVATGTFASVFCGHMVKLTGAWTNHPKFGKRFEVQTCYSTTPTSLAGLATYLGSGLIKGVGPQLAERLVAQFGSDILKIIDEQPSLLEKVSGVGAKRARAISKAWHEQKELAHLMMFLQEKGLSVTYATKLYKTYREKTLAVLNENPYQLADDIWGIGFVLADDIAQKMGMSRSSPQRIAAGIRYCLKKAAQQGHLYVYYQKLLSEAHALLAIENQPDLLENSVDDLCLRGQLVSIQHENERLIALHGAYRAEKTVAEKLRTLLSNPPVRQLTDHDIHQVLHDNQHTTKFTEEQQYAIRTALTRKVCIITGGPGTGKTTILSMLLATLKHYTVPYKLAAPTGRAAKRMSERTGVRATTIHRLLEFDHESRSFKFNSAHPLKTNVLILDECSMIDIQLAQATLSALSPNTQLILIGDIDQLPPVGPGNFFRDAIASGVIPVVRLTKIFRQGAQSLITYNAHRIREGQFPLSAPGEPGSPPTDYIYIQESDPEKLAGYLQKVIFVETQLRGCQPHDAIVLAPMHRGAAGTQQLNQFLQSLYNPGKITSFTFAATTFKLNDRVMQIRNNYDKNVFNGDIGTITAIDLEEKAFTVDYEGKPTSYLFDEGSEIILAYATSIHKSQGSEFPVVIVPIFMQHFTMLRRNLLYTAITRAQKLCVVIGEKRALSIALRQVDTSKRITLLQSMLQES